MEWFRTAVLWAGTAVADIGVLRAGWPQPIPVHLRPSAVGDVHPATDDPKTYARAVSRPYDHSAPESAAAAHASETGRKR